MRHLYLFSSLALLSLLFVLSSCDDDDEVIITPLNCDDFGAEIDFFVPDSLLLVNLNGGLAPYTYQWGDGSDRSYLENYPGAPTTVTVTDATGCTAEAEIELQSGCFIFTRGHFSESNSTPNTFEFNVSAFGDAPPFDYNWSTGQTDSAIIITQAGYYGVSISDANGCLIGAAVTLNEGPNGLCELTAKIEHLEDGRLRTRVNRGSTNETYLWSDGSTGREILNPLPNTPYSVTVTNSEGCPATAQLRL